MIEGSAVVVRPGYLAWDLKLPGKVIGLALISDPEFGSAEILEIELQLEDKPKRTYIRFWDMDDWGPWEESCNDHQMISDDEKSAYDTHIEEVRNA